MLTLALSSGVVVASGHQAAAADDAPLPEIKVTGKRVSEAEQRAPTVSTTVVDIPSRDAPIETTADVLSQAVGVQVRRFGGLGAFSTISIRGSSASQVPIYLDGIPLSQAQDPSVNLSDLPLDSLDRVEVFRGVIPVGFGGGGIGGLVNLVTRPPSVEPHSEVSLSYGSFETRKVVVTHTRQVGPWSILGQVSYLGSKGDFTYFDDNGTPENSSDDSEATRINNEFDAIDCLLKGTRELADGLVLDLLGEGFYKDQGVPGPGSTQFAKPSLRNARSLTYARLRKKNIFEVPVDASASLFGVYSLQEFDDPQGSFGAKQATHNQSMLLGGNSTGTWYAPYDQVVSGFSEIAYEEFFPSNAFNGPLPEDGPDQSRLRFSLALQDEVRLLSDRIAVVPSLRYDHLADRISGTNLANKPNSAPSNNSHDLVTPAIGIEGRVTSYFVLRANLGRAQRAPSFAELFGNTGSVLGNAKLKPETALNRDIGFVVTLPDDRGLELRLEYAYFHNDVDDLIAFEQVSPRQFRPFNLDRARLRGHELALSLMAFEHFAVDLNYTHQDAEDLGIDSPEGNQLPLRPADELFARPRFVWSWGSAYYEYTYLGPDPTDADNFIIVPERSIHALGFSLQVYSWLTAKFEAANLADADVRDLGNFPLPGRSFFGGIKASF